MASTSAPLALPVLRLRRVVLPAALPGPAGQTFQKCFVYPTILLILFFFFSFPVALTCQPSRGNTQSYLFRLLRRGESSVKLLTLGWAFSAAPQFLNSIEITWHQIHSFIHCASQSASHHATESYALLKLQGSPVRRTQAPHPGSSRETRHSPLSRRSPAPLVPSAPCHASCFTQPAKAS